MNTPSSKKDNLRILFLTIYESATLINLRSYIRSKTDTDLDVMLFGMPIIKNGKLFQDLYFTDSKGEKISKKISFNFSLREPLLSLFKFVSYLYVFFILLKIIKGRTYDICIAETSTLGVLAWVLKKLGKCKMTIFFCGDIYAVDSKSIIGNFFVSIQKLLRRVAYKNDVVWYISQRLRKWDKERNFIPKKFFIRGIYIFDQKKISKYAKKSRSMHKISYIGRLAQCSGLEAVIRSIKYIKKKVPNIIFRVIGGYSERDCLYYKKLAKRQGVLDRVQFFGYIEDVKKVENILAESALGMAVYNPDERYAVSYTEVGKVKDYFDVGIPVVVTKKGPTIAKDIKKYRAGVLVEYDPQDIAEKVTDVLIDKEKYKILKEGVLLFTKERSYENVLPATYKKIVGLYAKHIRN